MIQFIRDRIAAIWQGRFQHGISSGFGSIGIMKYANGWVLQGSGPELCSPGTGHWPWFSFEFGKSFTTIPSWHVGILGFTFGMLMAHNVEDDGTVAGPDYKKYYWFFKGLNHQNKEFGEII